MGFFPEPSSGPSILDLGSVSSDWQESVMGDATVLPAAIFTGYNDDDKENSDKNSLSAKDVRRGRFKDRVSPHLVLGQLMQNTQVHVLVGDGSICRSLPGRRRALKNVEGDH